MIKAPSSKIYRICSIIKNSVSNFVFVCLSSTQIGNVFIEIKIFKLMVVLNILSGLKMIYLLNIENYSKKRKMLFE